MAIIPSQFVKDLKDNEITLGTLRSEDLSEFVEFYPKAFGGSCNIQSAEKHYATIANNPDYTLLTAKVEGKLCGYLMAVIIQDFVEDGTPFMTLWSVCVHPEYRRHGIGTTMMGYIEKLAKKKNCEFITFISGAHRTSAHAFYERLGYDLKKEKGVIKFLNPA